MADVRPSVNDVLFGSHSNIPKLSISFPTFFDLCALLEIDGSRTALSLYSVRKKLRAIRIFGFLSSNASETTVFPGRSKSYITSRFRVPSLTQYDPAFCEGQWETGFDYNERPNTIDAKKTYAESIAAFGDDQDFHLLWERTTPSNSTTCAASIHGQLTIKGPSVLIRSRVLLESIQRNYDS